MDLRAIALSFRRAMRKVDSRVKFRREQDYAFVRSEYERLSPDEKNAIRQWVERIAEHPPPDNPFPFVLTVDIRFLFKTGTDEIEPIRCKPQTLLKAITAWDNDEDFVINTVDA